jgi:hypothetical protein
MIVQALRSTQRVQVLAIEAAELQAEINRPTRAYSSHRRAEGKSPERSGGAMKRRAGRWGACDVHLILPGANERHRPLAPVLHILQSCTP